MKGENKTYLKISVSAVTSQHKITVTGSCTSFDSCTLGTRYTVNRISSNRCIWRFLAIGTRFVYFFVLHWMKMYVFKNSTYIVERNLNQTCGFYLLF